MTAQAVQFLGFRKQTTEIDDPENPGQKKVVDTVYDEVSWDALKFSADPDWVLEAATSTPPRLKVVNNGVPIEDSANGVALVYLTDDQVQIRIKPTDWFISLEDGSYRVVDDASYQAVLGTVS